MVVMAGEGGPKNKKIIFDDEGDVVTEEKSQKKKKNKEAKEAVGDNEDVNTKKPVKVKKEKGGVPTKHTKNDDIDDAETPKKWYEVYSQYPSSEEILDMKDSEQMELHNLCRSSYEQEKSSFMKKNPSDARWLQTALHKGTAKDRANAGALLVTSNPLANLEALSTLIGFTKMSNKSCVEVTAIITDLWKEVLLPAFRKLYSIQMRGADWKALRKDSNITKEQQRRIYAYWHFENELKDLYFEFLKNLQQSLQGGQENNKTTSIVAASQLLMYAPEKEQMLLTMLINKLGDPLPKVASKALHHLTDVSHRHPNMCGVIVTEAEKLLFRNNISERAQHFALCFLASIAPAGRPEVCTKLVNICFALFKVLVQRGAVNSRTMQAILRCLQKAIVEAKPTDGNKELLSKDMQDTIYRLVHLADIHVSIQTLGLLLQLVTVKTEKGDRFYNALYKKLLDMNLTTIGNKAAAQLLHIVHRAVYIDSHVPRAQAFVKRLLQLALYTPSNVAAGCLIVIQKLLQTRKELCPEYVKKNADNSSTAPVAPKILPTDEELNKFDSDGEEKYEDAPEDASKEEGTEDTNEKEEKPLSTGGSSWHHTKVAVNNTGDVKVKDMAPSKYDPFHRVPDFAGAEFALQNELLLLRRHIHPTIEVFAENVLNNKRIDYYGDPLRDFGLAHFLERFSFKNPKKLDDKSPASQHPLTHKSYKSYGSRGMSVKSLTKNNCTEEEMFIFNYLEHKRKQAELVKTKTDGDDDDEEEGGHLQARDVDDDEFEDYLDGFFGKKSKKAQKEEDGVVSDPEELDFLKDLGVEPGKSDGKIKKAKSKKKSADEDDVEDIDADWGDDDGDDEDVDDEDEEIDGDVEFEGNDVSDDEEGSIDFNEDDDDDDIEEDDDDEEFGLDGEDDFDDGDNSMSEEMSDDEMRPPKAKKSKKDASALNERSFAKKLKHSTDMSSLFAAADDFAELLEETGKTKGQGTSNAVFNKDKSSQKQLAWEEKRRSNSKNYSKKSKPKGKGNFSKRK
ncbi:nucleolar complex protein 1 [Musca autumnalis]|uniref:nucleolar complex protein 1 n=1 Tax=Musca autumnalis TaxID=221902 RepID=UPI003CE78514